MWAGDQLFDTKIVILNDNTFTVYVVIKFAILKEMYITRRGRSLVVLLEVCSIRFKTRFS